MPINVERSSGNVFRDLGFSPAEAENLRVRAELMVEISRLIKRRKLTQAAAAKLMGVTQPRISDLVRGKIGLFRVETLLGMLTRAGVPVRIQVGRDRKQQRAKNRAKAA